jgi:hypothetical protein
MLVSIFITVMGALATLGILWWRKPKREFAASPVDAALTRLPDPYWTLVHAGLGVGVTAFGIFGIIHFR